MCKKKIAYTFIKKKQGNAYGSGRVVSASGSETSVSSSMHTNAITYYAYTSIRKMALKLTEWEDTSFYVFPVSTPPTY